MKILIVEDEVMLADSIMVLLQANGFDVDCVFTGEDGASYGETGVYDLLILDVMLPGLDGFQVARRVRSSRCGTPILMLTAMSALDSEIDGLNSGADYYLTKPFDTRKLLACINALLRRQGSQVNDIVVGNTCLSLSSCTLSCGSNRVRLSAKEFDVIRFLMSSPGQIISKEQILCRVWGFESNAVENNVEVYVGLIRKKLDHIGSNIRIVAVRRMGYLMEVRD